jgi:hypothetical protein
MNIIHRSFNFKINYELSDLDAQSEYIEKKSLIFF